MKVLLNNKIVDQKKLKMDTGYFYGYGVFETILIREGLPVLIEQHLERMNKALKKLDIHKEITLDQVEYAIAMLGLYNVALKINVSEANVLYSRRSIAYTQEQYSEGAKLCVSKVYRNPSSPTVNIKSMNYMDNILEMKAARQEGYNDALFLNYRGEVCETAVANIFYLKKDKIYTPLVSCGLLDGVLRQWLMSRYEVQECLVTLEDLIQSEGVFMTNSLMGIMKVQSIDGVKINENEGIGAITKAYVDFLKESGDSHG